MIESLSKLLIENGLEPDSFTPSVNGDAAILRGEVPAGRVLQTWANLAKAASETKYWPIIRGDSDDIRGQTERDPESILAAAPSGNIREILESRMQERLQELREVTPDFAESTDMDHLAAIADASGMYSFNRSRHYKPKVLPGRL